MKTLIKGRWVVGYRNGTHYLLKNGQVAFEDDKIVYVGPDYRGKPDRTIDATNHLVSPGLINYHAVANVDLQVLRTDVGSSGFPKSKEFLFDPCEPYVLDEDRSRASAQHSVLQLLKSGSTTFGAITTGATKRWGDPPYEPVILAETAGEMGARGYFAHQFWARGSYSEGEGRTVVWDEEKGFAGLERAVEFAESFRGEYEGRIGTYIFPYTLDSCTPDLLREAAKQARKLGLTIRTHFAQYPGEVEEIMQKHGRSPVGYLADLDFLGSNATLTHAIYIAGKDGTPYPDGRELDLLAETGTTVCNCPVVFVRSGEYLDSFARYLDHGINMTIGTDTFPQDLIEEMRMASYLGKIAERNRGAATSAEVYNACTLGGAQAFMRDDIGRLAVGAKADIITVDFSRPHLSPIDDPIKGLVNYAHGTDVDRVFVDGKELVSGGKAVGVDEEEIIARAQEAYDHMTSMLVSWDPEGRSREELFPYSFPMTTG